MKGVEEQDMDKQSPVVSRIRVDFLRTAMLCSPLYVAGLLFGYDIGSTSSALPILQDPLMGGVAWGQLSTLTSGITTSASLFGAMLGSLAAFLLKDRVGRRTELFFSATAYGIGAILSTAAVNLPMLVIGKLIYGSGIAFALHAAPPYLAEMGHPSIRGLLIGMKEVFIGVGIELGLLIGLPSLTVVGGWRIVFGAALFFVAFMAVGLVFIPESARWLLLADKPEQAKAALRWARGKYGRDSMMLDAEFDEMVGMSADLHAPRGLFFIMQRRFMRPLCIGLSLIFFQQITGQPSVLYYAGEMFQRAGLRMGQESAGIAGILGAFKLLMTAVAVLTVDRGGRRPLLLLGVGGMVLSALTIGVAVLASYSSMAVTYISIVGLFIFVGSYQISFGPISWIMIGEVFPLAVRGPAIGLAVLLNFGTNFVVTLVLPSIQRAFGMGGLYLGFGCMAALSWIVIYFIVPETKGRTLEEIEELLRQGKRPALRKIASAKGVEGA